ncbi:hypothetical protein SCANM63S_05516 [Streptomyces canarius]
MVAEPAWAGVGPGATTSRQPVLLPCSDPAFLADPFPLHREPREDGPARRAVIAGGPEAWLVTRYGDGLGPLSGPRPNCDVRDAADPRLLTRLPVFARAASDRLTASRRGVRGCDPGHPGRNPRDGSWRRFPQSSSGNSPDHAAAMRSKGSASSCRPWRCKVRPSIRWA